MERKARGRRGKSEVKRKTGKLTGVRGEDRGEGRRRRGGGKGAAWQDREPSGRRTRSEDTERTSFESQRQVKWDCSRTQV